jgi:hypothetical protein
MKMTQENTQQPYSREDVEKAATEGNPTAQYELSRIVLEEGNVEQSMKLLSEAVQQGFPPALSTSGVLMLTGRFIKYDAVNGMKNLGHAAQMRDENASLVFSHLTYAGIGGEKDAQKAIEVLTAAARRNNSHALCEIAALLKMRNVMTEGADEMMELSARHGSSLAAYLIAAELKDAEGTAALQRRINFLYFAAKGGNQIAEAEFYSYDKKTIDDAMAALEPVSLTPPEFKWAEIVKELSKMSNSIPLNSETLGKGKAVSLIKSALTDFEITYLRVAASPMLALSGKGLRQEEIESGTMTDEEMMKLMPRKGIARFDFMASDIVTQVIEEKIAAAAGFELTQSENLNVTFERSVGVVDDVPDDVEKMMAEEEKAFEMKCGARKQKVIIGIADLHEGGEVLIPSADVSHDLKAGDIMVVNLSKDLKDEDENDVKDGFKWAAIKWVREKPVPHIFR